MLFVLPYLMLFIFSAIFDFTLFPKHSFFDFCLNFFESSARLIPCDLTHKCGYTLLDQFCLLQNHIQQVLSSCFQRRADLSQTCGKHFGAPVSTSVKFGNSWQVLLTLWLEMTPSWPVIGLELHSEGKGAAATVSGIQWPSQWRERFQSSSPEQQPKKASHCACATSCLNNLVSSTMFWEHEYLNKFGKCELSLFSVTEFL